MFYVLVMITGQTDYKKTLNINAWTYCYSQYAMNPMPFFPPEFQIAAETILMTDFNMQESDITIHNAKHIYTHLVHIFEH